MSRLSLYVTNIRIFIRILHLTEVLQLAQQPIIVERPVVPVIVVTDYDAPHPGQPTYNELSEIPCAKQPARPTTSPSLRRLARRRIQKASIATASNSSPVSTGDGVRARLVFAITWPIEKTLGTPRLLFCVAPGWLFWSVLAAFRAARRIHLHFTHLHRPFVAAKPQLRICYYPSIPCSVPAIISTVVAAVADVSPPVPFRRILRRVPHPLASSPSVDAGWLSWSVLATFRAARSIHLPIHLIRPTMAVEPQMLLTYSIAPALVPISNPTSAVAPTLIDIRALLPTPPHRPAALSLLVSATRNTPTARARLLEVNVSLCKKRQETAQQLYSANRRAAIAEETLEKRTSELETAHAIIARLNIVVERAKREAKSGNDILIETLSKMETIEKENKLLKGQVKALENQLLAAPVQATGIATTSSMSTAFVKALPSHETVSTMKFGVPGLFRRVDPWSTAVPPTIDSDQVLRNNLSFKPSCRPPLVLGTLNVPRLGPLVFVNSR